MFTKEDIAKAIENVQIKSKASKELSLEALDEKSRQYHMEQYKLTLQRIEELKQMLEEMN